MQVPKTPLQCDRKCSYYRAYIFTNSSGFGLPLFEIDPYIYVGNWIQSKHDDLRHFINSSLKIYNKNTKIEAYIHKNMTLFFLILHVSERTDDHQTV